MNNLNYENQYKDKDPKETIKIVKDFFNKYNFTIIEDEITNYKNIDNIWTTVLTLYYKNIKITTQRGKGISQDFALASGYAELYERFVNKLFIASDQRLMKMMQDANYTTNGYYFSPNEISSTIQEIINADSTVKQYFEQVKDTNIVEFLDNKLITTDYINLTDNLITRYNPWLITKLMGSNGMAAGNTLEEALVQGISELFERESVNYISNNIDETYTVIPHELITNETLKSMINALEDSGEKIVIFDTSYNTGLPTVLVCFINKITKRITYSFGAHPIFDIALQRCLLEPCQDIEDLNAVINLQEEIDTVRQINQGFKSAFIAAQTLYSPANIFTPKLILYSTKGKINTEVFKDFDNNADMLEQLIHIAKGKHINIYCRDNSSNNNLKAIQLYSPDIALIHDNIYFDDLPYKGYLFNYFDNDTYSKYLDEIISHCITDKMNNNFNNLDKLIKVYDLLYISEYKQNIEKYMGLYRYRAMGYNKNEVKDLFDYCGDTFTDEEWNDCINITSLVTKILPDAFENIFNSSILSNIIEPLID